jgi:hypothetical protein
VTLCCGVSIPDDSKDHCSFIFRVLDSLIPRDEGNVENYSHRDTPQMTSSFSSAVVRISDGTRS